MSMNTQPIRPIEAKYLTDAQKHERLKSTFDAPVHLVLRENDWFQRRTLPMGCEMNSEELPLGCYFHAESITPLAEMTGRWRAEAAKYRAVGFKQQARGDLNSADVSFQSAQDYEAFADELDQMLAPLQAVALIAIHGSRE